MAITTFGMSAGLSFFVIVTVLMFRLSSSNVDPKIIAAFAFVGLPYNIRVIWPFIIDHVKIPYFSKKFGQRRFWGILSQLMSGGCLLILGTLEPATNISAVFFTTLVLAFFSAIHDIISEAYRFHFVNKIPQSSSVPLQTIGFRSGQIIASSAIPIIASFFSWQIAHISVSFIKLICVAFIFLLKEPNEKGKEETKNSRNLRKFIWGIFYTAAQKPYLWIFIISIIIMRVIDTITGPLQTIFIGKLGIDSMQFGIIKGGIGVTSTMLGIPVAGYLVKKIRILNTLFIGIIFQSLAGLLSIFLVKNIHNPAIASFIAPITATQDFFQGFMNTSLIIYISAFCEKRFSIYHFTLFSTISSMSRAFSTYLFSNLYTVVGWNIIFCIPLAISIPLALLLAVLSKNQSFLEQNKSI